MRFFGRWIDRGQAGSGSNTIYLVEAGNPTEISDILQYSWHSDSDGLATIEGTFLSDINGNLGSLPAGVTGFVEDGRPVSFSLPFLGGEIHSDVDAVPEPASLALVGLALIGLGLSRRRQP